nr:nuclear envelope pore membrane protein POM 121-like [Castor canadensis]
MLPPRGAEPRSLSVTRQIPARWDAWPPRSLADLRASSHVDVNGSPRAIITADHSSHRIVRRSCHSVRRSHHIARRYNARSAGPSTPSAGPTPMSAPLCSMRGYVGKPGPPPCAQDRLGQRPSPRSPPPLAAQCVLHVCPSLPTPLLRDPRRPRGDSAASSCHLAITPQLRCPIPQARYSVLGALPTVCWDGDHQKAVLSARNSTMLYRLDTVRIPAPRKRPRPPGPEHMVSSAAHAEPDPGAKELPPSALEDGRKRTKKDEDQILGDEQGHKRRYPDCIAREHALAEPLLANASLVPKPESLKRGLTSQSSDLRSKRSCTSSVSSMQTGDFLCSSLNTITSSYSSTVGISQLWKKGGPTSPPFSSQASSGSQMSERPVKKAREEGLCHPSSSSAPQGTTKEFQGERAADGTTGPQKDSRTSSSTPAMSGSRRRKTRLLPCRRGVPLTLPPPPQLGCPITAEDLDLERKARFQWFNKALEDKTDAASTSVPEKSLPTQPPVTHPACSQSCSLAGLSPGLKFECAAGDLQEDGEPWWSIGLHRPCLKNLHFSPFRTQNKWSSGPCCLFPAMSPARHFILGFPSAVPCFLHDSSHEHQGASRPSD